jgi:hypothetical protein
MVQGCDGGSQTRRDSTMARKHHEDSYRSRVANTSEEYDADRHVRAQMRDHKEQSRKSSGRSVVSKVLGLTDRLGR